MGDVRKARLLRAGKGGICPGEESDPLPGCPLKELPPKTIYTNAYHGLQWPIASMGLSVFKI